MNDAAAPGPSARARTGKSRRGAFDALPPDSEIAIADEFVRRYRGMVSYIAEFHRWMVWDGTCWGEERTLWVYDRCIRLVAEFAADASLSMSAAQRVATRKTASNVLDLIRADRQIAADADQWDTDRFLLNTPKGVVHLDASRIVEPSRADLYMTKEAAVAPDSEMPIELWLRFLVRVTGGNDDLLKYLQRVCGYCLTADVSEHALFFLWGTGSNGKSVFIDTISRILADYHRTAGIDTFTASHSDRHPTELANLVGARLVTAIETEEGRRWDETRIKALTGGDRISARFMRQDFFEYTPQFKLVIAGNHKPSLRSVDEAIRRRMHMIPFAVKIPAEERNTELAAELQNEWPGILHWMLEGCRAWQAGGLKPPSAVVDATKAYLNAEDVLGTWLAETCDTDNPNSFELTSALYASWRHWAERSGEFVGSQKRFSQALQDRGFNPDRTAIGRIFRGLQLKPEPQPPPQDEEGRSAE